MALILLWCREISGRNLIITECLQVGCSIPCICWIARISVSFGLKITKMTAFLLKSHRELTKFTEVMETKPAALRSSF